MKTIKIIPGLLLIADVVHLIISINKEQVITTTPNTLDNNQYRSSTYHTHNKSYFQWLANYYLN